MPRNFVEWFSKRRWQGLAGLITVAVLALIGFYPSIKVGFLGDDWWFLGKAASLNLPDYLAFYFDPRTQIFWYRPLYGILLLIEYAFFRSTPDGYHLGQIILHAINCLLLMGVVWQLSRRWRLAFLAALFYALLPVNNLAVFWIAVQDPLAMVFYLASIWFWVIYLQSQRRLNYGLAFGAFVLSLMGKEASVFLPISLFLIDRLLIAKPISLSGLIRRYLAWVVVLLGYLVIEYRVQTTAYFPNRWGYSIGFHVIENLFHYLALSIFPWADNESIIYVILAIVGMVLLFIGIRAQSKLLLFLWLQALLTIAPAIAFPVQFFQARYLYFTSAVTAVLFAMALEIVHERMPQRVWTTAVVSVAALIIVFLNSAVTTEATAIQVEAGRQMRVPLRDIYQQHPEYPPGTYLYFVEPPYPMIMRNLTGMFLLRYGTNVNVWSSNAEFGGVDEDRFANLRDHKNSFVYYFDSSGNRHEVAVNTSSRSAALPLLPVTFQSNIRLEGYELTSATVKQGGNWALILYWKSIGPIDQNYTVFIHLVDNKGETLFGEDTLPAMGRLPTNRWYKDKLVVDAHTFSVPDDVPPGKYHLEVGMYYLPTLERLAVVDSNGSVISDRVVIEPIEVVESTAK